MTDRKEHQHMTALNNAAHYVGRRAMALAFGLALVAAYFVAASPAHAQVGGEIKSAATSAATAGIAAGAAVAVIVLGGTVVYKLVKKFTS
ncbi:MULTISPECIES: hypothetical protein [Actinomycetota]|uniref:hypothetical protein n=1 Tax=Actinomycetota TaxID=201174 RepID=UPI00064BD852|nr:MULTISPECIES: hypothetical protein [Actinomycetota]